MKPGFTRHGLPPPPLSYSPLAAAASVLQVSPTAEHTCRPPGPNLAKLLHLMLLPKQGIKALLPRITGNVRKASPLRRSLCCRRCRRKSCWCPYYWAGPAAAATALPIR